MPPSSSSAGRPRRRRSLLVVVITAVVNITITPEMAMLVDDLEPHIRKVILATPSEQLGTITARSVREQLVACAPGISKDWVKANKSSINELIGSVFEQLVPPPDETTVPPVSAHAHAKVEPQDDGGPSTPPTQQHSKIYANTPNKHVKPKTSSSKKNHVLTDEEYARRLSAELNGHVSRSSRSGKVPSAARAARNNARGSGSAKKAKKSAERVDDSDASDDDGGGGDGEDGSDADERRRTRTKPKKGKRAAAKGDGGGTTGGAKGGFQKEYLLR